MTETISAHPYGSGEQMGGKRRGVPVKTLKKILKKAGLKTTGKKAALTRRAKQAKLVKKGGNPNGDAPSTLVPDAMKEAEKIATETENAQKGGRKRKSRSRGMRFF